MKHGYFNLAVQGNHNIYSSLKLKVFVLVPATQASMVVAKGDGRKGRFQDGGYFKFSRSSCS